MAKPLTTTSHAVLGLLNLRSWTTYELAKQVQRSLGWFWPRAERKLYDEPKHLVEAGLASARQESTGNRPRTVYAITDEGREALGAWLSAPAAPPALEFEGMVKVFFADGGSLEQLRANLLAIETAAEERLGALRTMVAESHGQAYEFTARLPLNALGLRFQIDHEANVARWARWARDQVSGWASPTDVRGWDWRAALAD